MLRKTPRTTLYRKPVRGFYDRELAYSILDEALYCSVGFVFEGDPYVLPMAFARWGDRLILHGARASRLLRTAAAAPSICVAVTIVDGVVLARSAMHHSMNYRSVAVLGRAVELTDPDEKRAALCRTVDHFVEGRSRTSRPPNPKELDATTVLALPIDEASVKVRSGGPVDDAEDLGLDFWAGEIPVHLTASSPVADQAHPPAPPTGSMHLCCERRER